MIQVRRRSFHSLENQLNGILVEFSSGSSDDGCGIVVLMEILSNLVNDLRVNLRENDLIILLTNGEEIGAEGAQAFLQHHWAENIRYFVSIDAAICHQKAQLVRMKPSKVCSSFSKTQIQRIF